MIGKVLVKIALRISEFVVGKALLAVTFYLPSTIFIHTWKSCLMFTLYRGRSYTPEGQDH